MLHPKFTDSFKNLTELYLNTDVTRLALGKPTLPGVDFQFFISQLALLQKAKFKLPTFFHKRCLFTTKGFEQCTSEAVALYKSSLFSGDTLLDLTGGLGIDDWAFSRVFKSIYSFDPDEELNEIVRHNMSVLNINHINRITGTAEQAISSVQTYDLVYADPDRRVLGVRTISIDSLEPAIIPLLPRLWNITNRVAIKLSPLFDLVELYRQFQHLEHIYIIAEKNEVKEILVVLNKNQTGPCSVSAVNLESSAIQCFTKLSGEILEPVIVEEDVAMRYFYEPNHALIKSGLWRYLAADKQMQLFSLQCPYMYSQEAADEFQGRSFEVQEVLPYKIRELIRYLERLQITQAHVNRREFPDDVALIRRKLKLPEGGDHYLFFTRTGGGEHICIHGRKLKSMK